MENTSLVKRIFLGVLSIVVIVIFFSFLLYVISLDKDIPNEDKISRSYNEIVEFLDEVPKNIDKIPYQSHIPEIMLEDIDEMSKLSENLNIQYSDDDSCIEIRKNIDTEKIEVNIITYKKYNGIDEEVCYEDFSFYKDGNNIIIFGCDNSSRVLRKSILPIGEGKNELSVPLDNDYIDLLGVDKNFEKVNELNDNMTFVKQDNSFYLYRYSQIVDSITFPNKIINYDDGYILDEKYNLYYLYYSVNLENHWIKSVRIAENIDKLSNNEYLQNDLVSFPVYIKNNKKYAGIVDSKIEENYGRLCQYHNVVSDEEEILTSKSRISVSVVNVDDKNIKNVLLTHEKDTYSVEPDWCLQYEFDVKGKIYYIQKRIDDLDSETYFLIKDKNEKELEKFENKNMSLDEVEGVVKQLRNLYKKYEVK